MRPILGVDAGFDAEKYIHIAAPDFGSVSDDDFTRYAVGFFMLAFWGAWFGLAGRKAKAGEGKYDLKD